MMEIADAREALRVRDSDLSESSFSNARLAKASFDDVNLQGSTFVNINLGASSFRDVNLAGATVEDANLTGMTINGVLVSDLIRAYQNRPQAVLYARNLNTLQAFYKSLFLFQVEQMEPDHVVLSSPDCTLAIVQVPQAIAANIHIATPPKRRTETPVKLIFDVENIAAARDMAHGLGGGIDPAQCEWTFQGCRVCDGHDPEGNVIQCRERPREIG